MYVNEKYPGSEFDISFMGSLSDTNAIMNVRFGKESAAFDAKTFDFCDHMRILKRLRPSDDDDECGDDGAKKLKSCDA